MIQEIVNRFEKVIGEVSAFSDEFNKLYEIASTELEKFMADVYVAKGKLIKSGYHEADPIFDELAEQAGRFNLISLRGFVFMQKGNAASLCGRHEIAHELLIQALSLMDPEEENIVARIHQSLGYTKMSLRKYQEAETELLTGLRMFSQQHDDLRVAIAMMTIGQLYLRQGQYIDAREHLIEAITFFRKTGRTEHLNIALHDYGLFLLNTYDQENAVAVFKEIIESFGKTGSGVRQGMAYFNLALSYQRLQKYEEAEKYYLQALTMLQSLNNKLYFRKIHNNLALTYGQSGKNDLAIKHFKIAYDIACEQDSVLPKYTILINIIHYRLLNNQFSKGMRKQIDEALAYFEANKEDELVIKTKKVLARYHLQKKEYKTAFEVQKDATLLTEEFYDQQLRDQNRDFLETFQESIHRRERIQNLLSPSLQSTVKHNLIGQSASIREITKIAKKASSIPNVNVVITGESGTGKEIIARLIHYNSDRRENRLLTVNCSAITETLAESEFFGHIAGSFTGALKDKTGYFEQADGGTLFLDEIGDMPIAIQAKLLRAIETGKITAIGSDKEIDVDVRIVASTNKDLDLLVRQNRFRLDLLHRINTIHIHIPPLRDRDGDLELLAEHFISETGKSLKRGDLSIDKSYLDALRSYPFPGNVRELKNIITRSVILEKSNTLTGDSLPKLKCEKATTSGNFTGTLNLVQLEKEAVLGAFEIAEHSQKRAAQLLGITESTMSRKLMKYRQ